MLKSITAAAALSLVLIAPASAATLSGTFDVVVANLTGLNSAESEANLANFNNAVANGDTTTFTYTGDIDFGTFDGTDATTIADWLATGPGAIGGAPDAGVLGQQLSSPNINNGTATSTFFQFTLQGPLGASDFTVVHDDGVALFDDGAFLGGNPGPTSQVTTPVAGFNGGEFSFVYVATNGDPSVLNVDVTPVPLPAAFPLLAGGIGLLGFLTWRRKRAA
ncbi:MAG: PEP-CTERM sorting domain-containing protein [Pseudomonadota bacterium]